MSDGFIQVGQTLINIDRLIVVGPSPRVREGHFLAVWDTGQELMLSQNDAEALMSACQARQVCKPSDGVIAMTSDKAM